LNHFIDSYYKHFKDNFYQVKVTSPSVEQEVRYFGENMDETGNVVVMEDGMLVWVLLEKYSLCWLNAYFYKSHEMIIFKDKK